jgi:hypothetical protein
VNPSIQGGNRCRTRIAEDAYAYINRGVAYATGGVPNMDPTFFISLMFWGNDGPRFAFHQGHAKRG